jgi:hypothetical protein
MATAANRLLAVEAVPHGTDPGDARETNHRKEVAPRHRRDADGTVVLPV